MAFWHPRVPVRIMMMINDDPEYLCNTLQLSVFPLKFVTVV